MTESQKSGSTENKKSSDNKEALKLERQKCKVLKNALKEEKKAREQTELDLKAAVLRIDQVTQQMQEKEKRYLELYQEKIHLEETIMRDASDQKKLMNRMSFNVGSGQLPQ